MRILLRKLFSPIIFVLEVVFCATRAGVAMIDGDSAYSLTSSAKNNSRTCPFYSTNIFMREFS